MASVTAFGAKRPDVASGASLEPGFAARAHWPFFAAAVVLAGCAEDDLALLGSVGEDARVVDVNLGGGLRDAEGYWDGGAFVPTDAGVPEDAPPPVGDLTDLGALEDVAPLPDVADGLEWDEVVEVTTPFDVHDSDELPAELDVPVPVDVVEPTDLDEPTDTPASDDLPEPADTAPIDDGWDETDVSLPTEDAEADVGMLDAQEPPDVVEPTDMGPADALVPDTAAPPTWPGLRESPCRMDGEYPNPPAVVLTPWFTQLPLIQPMALQHAHDGTDRVVVAERAGQLRLFENDPGATTFTTMLDLSAEMASSGEGGLLSFAFHPDYAENGRIVVSYTRWSTPQKTALESVIAEYTRSETTPDTFDPASKRVLLTLLQPFTNHNGGPVLFDATGMLLIGFGDGGSGGDPFDYGQDLGVWFGKVLRIDIDTPSPGAEYSVPADNPFLSVAGARPEIWATGLRNPWQIHRDSVSGLIYVADVGQGQREEVDLLERGANYGWRQWEGTSCFKPPAGGCSPEGMTFPIAEYTHAEGKSITGGVTYHGAAIPGLQGAYLYADYSSGRFWALRAATELPAGTPDASTAFESTVIADAAFAPVSFGTDLHGEVYVTQLFATPRIVRLDAAGASADAPFPPTLSTTGCFTELATLAPAPGLIPYDVNAPLWSDGAEKTRYWVPPEGGAASIPGEPTSVWDFPVGTVLVKHFELGDAAPGDPNWRPVETRFEVRRPDGWRFVTYAWRPDRSDADLLHAGGTRLFADPAGGPPREWTYPSPQECNACHRGDGAPTTPLGPSSAQLERALMPAWAALAPILPNSQVAAALVAGLATGSPSEPGDAFPDLTDALQDDLDRAARTYLHVQCASCHRPGGVAPSDLDLRATADLSTALCQPPEAGDLGVTGASLLSPGVPSESVVYLRMALDPAHDAFMPNLGVAIPDAEGLALIAEWIESGMNASACPLP